MSDLRELYQEVIIDHNRHPRNHHVMVDPSAETDGFNPLCGDKLTLYLKIENNHLVDVSFIGVGCAISQASASLMTEAMKGKTIKEAEVLFGRFHALLTTHDAALDATFSLDKLHVLAGVREYPARVKCATLAWHTLEAALHQEKKIVSTE